MIVFGDRVEAVRLDACIATLRRTIQECRGGSAIQIAEQRTNLVLSAASLVQGLLDELLEQRGCDECDAVSECAHGLLQSAGQWFVRAGQTDGDDGERGWGAYRGDLLRRLELLELGAAPIASKDMCLRTPEGHAFYAVYLELYEKAAYDFRARHGSNAIVIGIRTIGASLGAVVSAAVQARHGLLTVRPQGHPFERFLAMGPALTSKIGALGPLTRFLITDEGPGASGASFGAAIDWLVEQGVEKERIHLFPSHAGAPGARASPARMEEWERLHRHTYEFDSWFVPDTRARLVAPGLQRLDAGSWRVLHAFPREKWPPCFLQQERRKYLALRGKDAWLARFVGLGNYGARAESIARALASRGLSPPVIGLRHGFLVSVWNHATRPLPLVAAIDRRGLVDTVIRYLACRAADLGPARSGSTPSELLEMAVFNCTERLGREVAFVLCRFGEVTMCRLEAQAVRSITDNRLHAWEWLVLPDGALWKVDVTDHHAAHDCIGCQDICWDVAGATVELDLTPGEVHELEEGLANRTRYRPNDTQRRFYTICYLAFQLGYCTEAALTTASHDIEEAARLDEAANRYASKLHAQLLALS